MLKKARKNIYIYFFLQSTTKAVGQIGVVAHGPTIKHRGCVLIEKKTLDWLAGLIVAASGKQGCTL